MDDVNYTMLSGRLIRQPDERKTPSGATVCDLLVASNRHVPNKKLETGHERHTTFVKVTLWNEKASYFASTLKKGDKILVIGKLVDDNYYRNSSGEEQLTRGRLKLDQVETISVLELAEPKVGENQVILVPTNLSLEGVIPNG
jgi:single stranded DNA-binding protein